MTHCPECPFKDNLPIKRGRWTLYPQQALRDGVGVPVSRSQSELLYRLAKSGGVVPRDTLGRWVSPNSVDPMALAASMLHQIKKALGDETPIENVRGSGYRWAGA